MIQLMWKDIKFLKYIERLIDVNDLMLTKRKIFKWNFITCLEILFNYNNYMSPFIPFTLDIIMNIRFLSIWRSNERDMYVTLCIV